MYSSFSVDFRDEDHRPFLAQPGRHRAPEAEVKPVAPPAWANEHARPIPTLIGEVPTKPIPYPARLAPATIPPPEANAPAAEPEPTLLGQCLHALRSWWSK